MVDALGLLRGGVGLLVPVQVVCVVLVAAWGGTEPEHRGGLTVQKQQLKGSFLPPRTCLERAGRGFQRVSLTEIMIHPPVEL